MSAAAPIIPPRPVRAEQAAAHGADKLPEMPPRPISKRLDRSVSPANYPQSPLNEPFNTNLIRSRSIETSSRDAMPRPPSVQHLPSVGQEGLEYADIQFQPFLPVSGSAADAGAQTRNVAEDLHLHAPKPSLPKSSATAQVQAVTKTDPQQTAVHGIGSDTLPGHDDDTVGRVRSRASFSRPSSSISAERRASIVYGEEHGPAELGMRVPINPLLGDVQAPSPASFSPNHTGQNGEPRKRPHHFRTKSGREALPPGSYGLHGHGVPSHDPFEKDWYAKHPDQFQHEELHGHGVYESIGSGRGSFALSSDDLNKIVHDTAHRGAGFGTTGKTPSYPDEQIGYLASEHYVSRSQPATHNLSKTITNTSQPAVESPLRKSSFPADDSDPMIKVTKTNRSTSIKSDNALESENDDPIRVDAPKRHYNKVTGGEETINEAEVPHSYASHSIDDDRDYSVPILASDEVAKEVGGEYLQPAISPKFERRGSGYDNEHRSGDNTPTSRPSSRPGSIYGLHSASHSLSRFISHHDDREAMHTPLEDVDEYEPLFPDEDSKQKSLSHAERFKQRPDGLRHRFPSQDIWEDTPSSAMYVATVSTPDLPSQVPESTPSTTFEPPAAEAARKGEATEQERAKLMPKEERLARSNFAPHLHDDMPTRPGMQHRFPSQDIWEDSPDSSQLVTTLSGTPDDEPESLVEAAAKPSIPPRPVGRSKLGEGQPAAQSVPNVPARPPKRVHAVPPADAKLTDATAPNTELQKVPSIPDRPKPPVPARPAKKLSGDTLSKTISGASAGSADSNETEKALATSPPLTKAKPQIPARPMQQSKFANVKGNFMNDLNKKLGLGPPKEKERELEAEPEEVKLLEDARKGRARGPQRRAPAKSPVAAAKPALQFAISKPQSLWHIDDGGLLNVRSVEELEKSEGTHATELPVSSGNLEKMTNSTPANAPMPPLVDTSASKAQTEVERQPHSAREFADPSLGTPTTEKSDPIAQATIDSAALSKRTTASSGAASGQTLEREDLDPSTDAIPASQQTTASIEQGFDHLEQSEKKAPKEPVKIRDEQVSGPAPSASGNSPVASSNAKAPVGQTEEEVEDIKAGAHQPAEPMPENDVSYAQLEEMQAQADGKAHSAEEVGTKKIIG